MQYRPFGKLGFSASVLGFGCMRLPTLDGGAIDEAQATEMLHYAVDHGVNYLDTAYPYHGGESERFLGRALQGGLRNKVTLATKLPARMVNEAADFDRFLNEQLARLQTDHIDVYLLHGLRRSRWDLVYNLGVLDWAEGALADGRIGAIGFSFHDTYDVFREIVDAYDGWHMCQIQYNYMHENYQAGVSGLRYAAERGMAVVVMEPVMGGRLANPPEPIRRLWAEARVERSPVEWALQWVWNQPEVSVVLSGMSAMAHMRENVAAAERSHVGILTADDLALIDRVRDAYRELSAVPCTGCGYCMPCPQGVDIPRNLDLLNVGVMYGMDDARRRYPRLQPDQDERILASSCIQCRLCEEKCPQDIAIGDWMPYVHEVLAEGRPYDPGVSQGF
jgi:predicted aldo/keto reductase-like oxidoreductase